MRKLCFFFIISATIGLSQENPFRAGTVELSVNADFGSIAVSTYQAFFLSSSVVGTNSSKYALFELRSGFFLFNNFSVEPEIGIHFLQHSAPSFYLIPNLSYSIPVSKRLGVFLRGGLGYSNSATLFGVVYKVNGTLLTDKLSGPVVNLGTGVKIFITDDIAFRSELNYKFAQQELHQFGMAWANLSNLSVTFGVSLFL